MSQSLQTLAVQYQSFRTLESKAKKEKEQIGKEIKAELGTFQRVENPSYKIIWSEVIKNQTDWKGLAMALGATPEMIAAFTKQSEEDRLTVDVCLEDAVKVLSSNKAA